MMSGICSPFYSMLTCSSLQSGYSGTSISCSCSAISSSSFDGFYSFNFVYNFVLSSLINFSSFLICGVSFFCLMSSELNLFLTVCSVLLSSVAYSDHFFPPLATRSSSKESSWMVHAPLVRNKTTCACWDRGGSASARGSASRS
jgi:hypothetical protein